MLQPPVCVRLKMLVSLGYISLSKYTRICFKTRPKHGQSARDKEYGSVSLPCISPCVQTMQIEGRFQGHSGVGSNGHLNVVFDNIILEVLDHAIQPFLCISRVIAADKNCQFA